MNNNCGMETVFAIVPVHNRREHTRACLACLRAQTHPRRRVIVVDDGSTDGTAALVAKEYPEATLLAGSGDLWWAGGVNRGMEHALSEGSDRDFLLIVNNDMTFGEDFVSSLREESLAAGGAVVGPVCLDGQTGRRVDAGMVVDWKGVRIAAREDAAGAAPDALSTRGLLVPFPVARAVGTLDAAALPHYLSDVEYTLRIRRMGFPLLLSGRTTARLDTETSGVRVTPGGGSPIREIRDHLFSYRSPSNIVHWMRFLRICCPRRYLPRWVRMVLVSEAKFAARALLGLGRGPSAGNPGPA
jgi:glycosyltransferase involved in cell wall biosynthesis